MQWIVDGFTRRGYLQSLVSAETLRDVGFGVIELLACDFSLLELRQGGFTSAEMVKRFHGFGGWHVEDRSCDKYVYGRLWDADCMKRRPPAGEILPLLVTGTPYTGTRSIAELFAAMDVEVDHEAYAEMATVSSVHAFNDFVGGVPYPRSSEQTPWWKTRIISNRYDYQNAFRPRWKYSVHLTRCPLRVVRQIYDASQ